MRLIFIDDVVFSDRIDDVSKLILSSGVSDRVTDIGFFCHIFFHCWFEIGGVSCFLFVLSGIGTISECAIINSGFIFDVGCSLIVHICGFLYFVNHDVSGDVAIAGVCSRVSILLWLTSVVVPISFVGESGCT